MILEFLTGLVQRKFPGSALWVEQEGEEVFLKKGDETIAQYKGSDPWSFEDLLGAANLALKVDFEKEGR